MDHFELHSEYKPTGALKKATSSKLYWVSPVPARHLPWRTSSPS